MTVLIIIRTAHIENDEPIVVGVGGQLIDADNKVVIDEGLAVSTDRWPLAAGRRGQKP